MKGYRTFKTTMGRKCKVQLSTEEVAEQELYTLLLMVVTFLGTIALCLAWLWR